MSQARQFIPRAPRYVLKPQDRNILRYSLQNTMGKGGVETTLLVNLSETGAAFLVNRGAEPRLGERIKVEIPIPKGEQIAWWGHVVRTSLYEPRGWFSGDKFHSDP